MNKKVSKNMYVLRKLRTFDVSKKVMKQVYNALVQSVITFGITVWWGGCSQKDKNKLKREINIARKITNNKLNSIENLYSTAVENKAFFNNKQQKACTQQSFQTFTMRKALRPNKM